MAESMKERIIVLKNKLTSTGRKVASPAPWLPKKWARRPATDEPRTAIRVKSSQEKFQWFPYVLPCANCSREIPSEDFTP